MVNLRIAIARQGSGLYILPSVYAVPDVKGGAFGQYWLKEECSVVLGGNLSAIMRKMDSRLITLT